MKILKDLWWLFLGYAIFLGIYESALTLDRWMGPKEPGSKVTITISIPRGTGLVEIARLLEEEGAIASRHALVLLALWEGKAGKIQAGEYLFSPAQSVSQILDDLVAGNVLKHMVTIPEGFTMFDIARLIEEAGLVSQESFLFAARDRRLLNDLHIPAESAEGFLFPDTYAFTRDVTAESMIRTMVGRFWEVWQEDFARLAEERDISAHETVTLASIVEKEAAVAEERPLIASVFWNRLQKSMPLQADPTVSYGILEEESAAPKRVTASLLRHHSPYNTYLVKGLPQGPISNPGRDSLRAVLQPAQTSYLFFVSKGNGRHHFSSTLKEHNQAVWRYLKKPMDETKSKSDTSQEDKGVDSFSFGEKTDSEAAK
ncbi:MAG: endolytic transglycosylase MltG [Deltaproteobacteria bacterium]